MKHAALALAIIALFTALTSIAEEKSAAPFTDSGYVDSGYGSETGARSGAEPRKPDAGVDMTGGESNASMEVEQDLGDELPEDFGDEEFDDGLDGDLDGDDLGDGPLGDEEIGPRAEDLNAPRFS